MQTAKGAFILVVLLGVICPDYRPYSRSLSLISNHTDSSKAGLSPCLESIVLEFELGNHKVHVREILPSRSLSLTLGFSRSQHPKPLEKTWLQLVVERMRN